jgi:hypothetical protein
MDFNDKEQRSQKGMLRVATPGQGRDRSFRGFLSETVWAGLDFSREERITIARLTLVSAPDFTPWKTVWNHNSPPIILGHPESSC